MAQVTRPETSDPTDDAAGPAEHGTAQDGRARPARGGQDGTTRQAALWATVIALPLTLLAGVLVFSQLGPDPAPEVSASPTAARPQATGPVEMAAPALAERPATVCRALLSQLPITLRGLGQRPVTAGPEQNAAYGDPAVTVACGVPKPTVAPEAKVWVVSGVCWLPEQGAGNLVLTSVDREVPVRLTVPTGHEQNVQWAAPVSDSIVASVRSVPDVPAGCVS